MSDSIITKKAIAASLRELMRRKRLAKITVSDIVKNCGLNRQTFYYHFKDKYDLLNWVITDEVASALSDSIGEKNWSEAMLEVLNTMKREKAFYINALGMDCQSAFFDDLFGVVRSMLLRIVDQLSESAFGGQKLAPADRQFIAEFYAHGLVGMVIQWAKSGMREPPEEIVERLTWFVDDSKFASSARYLNNNTKGD